MSTGCCTTLDSSHMLSSTRCLNPAPCLISVSLNRIMPCYRKLAHAVVSFEFWIFCLERITQSVVKSHIETSQYSAEELKRMAWTLYSPEETRSYQIKVYMTKAYDSATSFMHILRLDSKESFENPHHWPRWLIFFQMNYIVNYSVECQDVF